MREEMVMLFAILVVIAAIFFSAFYVSSLTPRSKNVDCSGANIPVSIFEVGR